MARSSSAVSRVAADATTDAATVFEGDVDKLRDYESSDLPDRTKVALRLADALSMAPQMVDEHVYAQLREHFDDDQILDLGMCMAFFTGWQRFIEAFGIVPDRWEDDATKPWEPGGAR
jgi:alkylhydroperoxidase family enzyme